MRRLTIRVTEDQYKALLRGDKPISRQVRGLLARQFKIPVEEGDKAVRVFQLSGRDASWEVRLDIEFLDHIKTEFKDRKIPAIKEVRARTGAGLKEAKDIVDTLWAEWGYKNRPTW